MILISTLKNQLFPLSPSITETSCVLESVFLVRLLGNFDGDERVLRAPVDDQKQTNTGFLLLPLFELRYVCGGSISDRIWWIEID
jgi:hypothetical protein